MHRVDELRRIYGVAHGGDRGNQYTGGKSANGALGNEPEKLSDVCVAAGTDLIAYKRYKHMVDLVPELQDLVESGEITTSVAARILSKLTAEQQCNEGGGVPF